MEDLISKSRMPLDKVDLRLMDAENSDDKGKLQALFQLGQILNLCADVCALVSAPFLSSDLATPTGLSPSFRGPRKVKRSHLQ